MGLDASIAGAAAQVKALAERLGSGPEALRGEAAPLLEAFEETLGARRVGHGRAHELDFLRTGFGDLCLGFARVG